jgi:hypothetical protein
VSEAGSGERDPEAPEVVGPPEEILRGQWARPTRIHRFDSSGGRFMIERFYWMTGACMGWALLGRPAFGQTAERSATLQDSSARHLNVKSAR